MLLLLLLLSRFSPTLWDPIDGSPPGSPVPGILQARTMEWVAISFSNEWKWKVKVKSLSRVRLLVTTWTVAYQALPSMGFSRQEYWSGLPLPSLLADATSPKWSKLLSPVRSNFDIHSWYERKTHNVSLFFLVTHNLIVIMKKYLYSWK